MSEDVNQGLTASGSTDAAPRKSSMRAPIALRHYATVLGDATLRLALAIPKVVVRLKDPSQGVNATQM